MTKRRTASVDWTAFFGSLLTLMGSRKAVICRKA